MFLCHHIIKKENKAYTLCIDNSEESINILNDINLKYI